MYMECKLRLGGEWFAVLATAATPSTVMFYVEVLYLDGMHNWRTRILATNICRLSKGQRSNVLKVQPPKGQRSSLTSQVLKVSSGK